MKPAEVYIEAARRIADKKDEFSCLAIGMACGYHDATRNDNDRYWRLRDSYTELMFGGENSPEIKELWWIADHNDQEARDLRVMLLLMMAARVESYYND